MSAGTSKPRSQEEDAREANKDFWEEYDGEGRGAAADTGFEPIGRVTLLVREVRSAVRQPAMVPAIQ